MEMEAIKWLILMVIFIAFEAATMGLYTIWFAGGSLVAFFVTLLGFNGWIQAGACIIVSGILLIFTRPIAQEKLNKGRTKTNADSLIGQCAKVMEPIDNVAGTGRAIVNGQEWMARSLDDSVTFPKEAIVRIEQISGVKIIVKKVEE